MIFENPVEAEVTLALNGTVMKLQIACDGTERLRLVAKLCFISYLAGQGVKIKLGGRRPNIP